MMLNQVKKYVKCLKSTKVKSKTCKDCKKEKDISEYPKSNNGTTYRGNCKKCHNINGLKYYQNHKEKVKEQYEEHKLDHYIVYYLPEENYCGVTNNPTNRIKRHKTQGNNPTGWRVLATTETLEEALTIEKKYHTELGMNGAKGWKKRAEITN